MLNKFIRYFCTEKKIKQRVLNEDLITIQIQAINKSNTLLNILNILNPLKLEFYHIESKPSEINKDSIPKVKFTLSYKNKMDNNEKLSVFDKVNEILRNNNYNIKKQRIPSVKRFPINLNELNFSGKLLMDLEQYDSDHVYFKDKEYIKRKENIVEKLDGFKINDPIPIIEYEEKEIQTWRSLYHDIKSLLNDNFCKEYIEGFKILEDEGLFSPNFVPQLEYISNFLGKKTGLKIKPVKGIVSQREYFEILAFRRFSSTQYLRHHSDYKYTPEPDLVHEFIGHVPMFCNNEYCDISQKLGLLSLGKSDEFVRQIGSLYWYTIEFGLILDENKNKRIFGGGIISSIGEIYHAIKCKDLREFEINKVKNDFDLIVTDYQKYFYYNKSLKEINEKLDFYIDSIKKDFYLSIDDKNSEISVDRCIKQI